MLKEICALDNSNVSQNSIMHILIFLFPHPELFIAEREVRARQIES